MTSCNAMIYVLYFEVGVNTTDAELLAVIVLNNTHGELFDHDGRLPGPLLVNTYPPVFVPLVADCHPLVLVVPPQMGA
jgi:hypothetical protein